MPRENPSTTSSARSSEPGAGQRLDRPLGRTVQSVQPREELEVFAGRQLGIQLEVVREKANLRAERGAGLARRPRSPYRTSPVRRLGERREQTPASVDLPAPLGPSNPMICPAEQVNVT